MSKLREKRLNIFISVKGPLHGCAVCDIAANLLSGFAALDEHACNVTGLRQADDGQITCDCTAAALQCHDRDPMNIRMSIQGPPEHMQHLS